ncbi:MAG: hypothetical protein IIB95_12030 [Candidatus Marinimicrobia bacterium]|nr:hypothetical protein [Candidatus Neomarinimicrobiota bacterium]
MIDLNGTSYSLCLIDSNIVSESLKNPTREGKRLVELIAHEKYIPAFSIFTVLELRQRPDIYTKFLRMFSVVPCVFTKSHQQLLDDEVEQYPHPERVSPVLATSLGVAAPPGEKLADVLGLVFSGPEVIRHEKMWNEGRASIVSGITSLVENFKPSGNSYTPKEIRAFIELAGFEQIARRYIAFAKEIVDKGDKVLIDAFPSLKMILYTVFYKFYVDSRKPLQSDAFDLEIASATPYVDVVMTERHQAEVIRKTKQRDSFLDHVDVRDLSTLRE